MTTQLFKRKQRVVRAFLWLSLLVTISFNACNKQDQQFNNGNRPSSYGAEVLDKWMTLGIRLMRNTPGVPNHAFSRHFAYAGVAALESLAPGLPAHQHLASRWNGLTGLPQVNASARYYWPANVNAAMAAISRAMFVTARDADKEAIDSLESVLNASFLATEPQVVIDISNQFGKAVAAAVYHWAESDGYKGAGAPYIVPVGEGLWVPTPPALAAPITPYWGNNRPIIAGSLENTEIAPPVAYSADPNSAFYQMVKQVYDASQSLTEEQKAMALFWRDVPGVTTPGHWLSILQQAVRQSGSRLDKAAFAYALAGSAGHDALIATFKAKYQYTLVRPITYIRNVMGYTSWSSFLGTPPHPEYPSAHAVSTAAVTDALQWVFDDLPGFTDHTYDYLGFAPRTYPSIVALGEEAGNSRLYAGIHYQASIDEGLALGHKIAANILEHPVGK